MNLIHFTTKDLPSRGLFYDRVYNITLRSLNIGQFKDLMRCNEKYFKDNIISVLDNIVETDGLNVYDMLNGDVMAIIMWYKCNSSNEVNLSLTYKCKKCDNKIETNINLGEFDEVSLDENIGEGVSLPSGKYLKYAPKTYLEYEKSNDTIGHICNVFKYLTPNDIDNFDLDDFLYLKDAVKSFEFGFRYKNNIGCRFCKSRYNMIIDAEYYHIFSHEDYNSIIKNILSISKYSNYQIRNDESLFDYETSIRVVNGMIKEEDDEMNKLTK